jgi:hypothetical protein
MTFAVCSADPRLLSCSFPCPLALRVGLRSPRGFNSNPQPQKASVRRPTPKTARPLGAECILIYHIQNKVKFSLSRQEGRRGSGATGERILNSGTRRQCSASRSDRNDQRKKPLSSTGGIYIYIYIYLFIYVVLDTSDNIAARRSGDRIPVEARFSARFQTGTGTHT